MEPDDRLRFELSRSVAQLTGALGWFVFLLLILVFLAVLNSDADGNKLPTEQVLADVQPQSTVNLPAQGSVTLGGSTIQGNPANGFTLYKRNCKSCHSVDGTRGVGPSLKGVMTRWDSEQKIKAWIRNPAEYLRTGDEYTNGLLKEYNQPMSAFGHLKEEEVNDILVFLGMQ